MSATEDTATHETQEEQHRPSSADTSDRENETFEDAVDTGSVRSLTQRKASLNRRLTKSPGSDAADEEVAHSPSSTTGEDKSKIIGEEGQQVPENTNSSPSPPPQHRRSQASVVSVSLDDVKLDDDSAPPPQTGSEKPPVEKEVTSVKSKTMSFSFSNALGSMPWSPPAVSDSPTKHAPTASIASTTTAATLSSAPAAAPAPIASAGRKLTSPFSWLSRSSSKEQANPPPPAVSPRRNTASSIATLTSNPEMMLSKLEEEKDGEGVNGPRNSLKDRFKLLRMREEAGIPIAAGDDDKTGGAIGGLIARSGTIALAGEDKETAAGLAAQPPPSPLPSPNPALAPGTASGVNAGPSAMSDVPVDWDLWQSVVYEGPAAVARTSPEELNKAIATGIPSAIRGVIWQVLAQSKNEELEVVYRDLVARGTDKDKDRHSSGTSISAASNGNLSIKEPASSASSIHSEGSGSNGNGQPSPTEKDSDSLRRAQAAVAAAAAERKKKEKEDMAMLQKLEKAIRRDLGARTSYSKFAAAQGLQEGLFGACKAYALFDEGVGYAQGMNFLVMPLLFNMPEEEAFCLLVRLMNQYHLRDLFIQDMPGLHKHLYQFERLLEDFEPALYCHLHRRGISPHLYATQWFLTLFAYRFPLQLVLRIYDLIFSEGLSAILKFGIVLMQKNATTLLGMSDMGQLSTFLKDRLFDVYIDASPTSNSILENGFFGSSSSSIDKEVYRADQLVRDACEVKITPEMLKAYATEWEEKVRAEKEREAELDSLKSANASYAIKVRKLEERIEAVDREQATLATELVHTKVENEELKDENESLKGQVHELKVVIEKQPQEIEAAWQLERDDLMKRNEKVHEENQRLEKELAELEEELVQTKMRYAEINSQHETLTRKWTDLKRQFQ
ncbi:putative TBC domain-containing protein [Diplogelasinospora grovesii]|uniref:GTPase-activating protein GYP5 n=1 Tax=Diplogelasinospora grovesii TaxID=303347 RepID=A0AAN6SAK7_9PEZI|nr:putative TBC domain-containing protein [Diplogelasinospora grovesii]